MGFENMMVSPAGRPVTLHYYPLGATADRMTLSEDNERVYILNAAPTASSTSLVCDLFRHQGSMALIVEPTALEEWAPLRWVV